MKRETSFFSPPFKFTYLLNSVHRLLCNSEFSVGGGGGGCGRGWAFRNGRVGMGRAFYIQQRRDNAEEPAIILVVTWLFRDGRDDCPWFQGPVHVGGCGHRDWLRLG